ncbi:hypothetical protein ACVBEG_00485 [Pseudomonas sp. GG8]
MNPNRYDLWDVHQAAGQVLAQAHSLSARHLSHGIPRAHFNREVAYYAKRIVDDVELGHKTPEQGIQALLQERNDLLNQAQAVVRNGHVAISDAVKRIPAYRLTQPVLQPDPERLLRFVHAQHLNTPDEKAQRTTQAVAPPPPVETYKFFPREQWPEPIELHDPGFYIVPKSTTAEQLEAQLFRSPNSAVIAKFRALNPGLDQVKAGQMIVLSDPENLRCTGEEALLMETARWVNQALADLSPEEADFMARHRDEIESFLTHGATAVGVGTAVFAKNLDEVKLLLKKIEALHTRTFEQHGHLRSPEFFAKRKELFAQLNTQLTSLTKKSIGFPDHPKLKTALGISSRSLVHRAGRAGGFGQNPGYATRITAVAKVSKYVQYGGWIGTAVGGGASYMKVQDVCRAGDAEACEKVKYTESGGFIGGVAGGALIGLASTAPAVAGLCVGLGVPTGGGSLLVCGIVLVGAASFSAGYIGGKSGEKMAEKIYEAVK